jgi:hypothetical protein
MLITRLDLCIVGAFLLSRGRITCFVHAKHGRRSELADGETENVFSNPRA